MSYNRTLIHMKIVSKKILFIALLFFIIISSPAMALSRDEVLSRFSSRITPELPTTLPFAELSRSSSRMNSQLQVISTFAEIEFPKSHYFCPPDVPVREVQYQLVTYIDFYGDQCSGPIGIDELGRRIVFCEDCHCPQNTPIWE